jgi:peptide chain release factor subunit 1
MQTMELDRERLRHLAGLRPPDGGKVLSLFLNLDPSQLPTAKDRSSAIGSLLDEAHRRVEAAAEALPHAAKLALQRDAEHAREYLSSGTSWAHGAHGLALFSAGGGEDLFEVVKLARPVEQRVVVDDVPWIEPLAHLLPGPVLLVVLVDRRRARFLHGPADALVELDRVEDDVHGWHDQGGWSQARYQRGIEKEVHDHLRRTAELTRGLARRRGCDRLAVGATGELAPAFESVLAPELRERLLGRFDIEIEAANAEAVGRAVTPLVENELARLARDAVDRLEARLGGDGPAAEGLGDVLAALTERRVETLIYADGFSARGSVCPRDGWIGPPAERCPVDGTETEARDNILDDAVERAFEQSADVLPIPEPELRGHGPIAAILRF